MLTIVWLPVATAMTGQMDADALQYVLYIGAMAVSSLLLMLTRLYLRAHPQLHDIPPAALSAGVTADLVIAALFMVSLLVAILAPGVGYYALFLLLLAVPIHRIIGAARARRSRA